MLLLVSATVGDHLPVLSAGFTCAGFCLSYPMGLEENVKREFLVFCIFLPFEEESCFPPGNQFTLEEITILYRSC